MTCACVFVYTYYNVILLCCIHYHGRTLCKITYTHIRAFATPGVCGPSPYARVHTINHTLPYNTVRRRRRRGRRNITLLCLLTRNVSALLIVDYYCFCRGAAELWLPLPPPSHMPQFVRIDYTPSAA